MLQSQNRHLTPSLSPIEAERAITFSPSHPSAQIMRRKPRTIILEISAHSLHDPAI